MKKFMDDNFLLQSETAEYLYHQHASKMPICDYHCHISPKDIAENRQFNDLTEVWLEGDHYKWRAMRSNGVSEKYITGDASNREKFIKWAETVPYTLRNPLYHWTHLELKDPFGIDTILNGDSAEEIYDRASAMLQTPEFSCRGLIEKANVDSICTTDDPIDTLEYHKSIAADSTFKVTVLPTWRPDKAMAVEVPQIFISYIGQLSNCSGIAISSFASLIEALDVRHEYFHSVGCRLSDHGMENFYSEDYNLEEVDAIFEKVVSGNTLELNEILKFKSAALFELALLNHKRGWAQQFHIGALRNNNSYMFNKIGPDTGFDSIGDWSVAESMSKFLNRLATEQKLSKSILYNLNPKDNEVLATMIGNFQDDETPGKMQFGSGWWFLDQKEGMTKQINTLSSLGLLSRFVGMLTDSRSFLSYPRHEYFRRILCNLIATDVENGEIPNDRELLGRMVEDISFNNAKRYFGI